MKVYRITSHQWSTSLGTSGNAARWNSDGKLLIYTANSRAMACLENVVHRSAIGLKSFFKTMVIEIPNSIVIDEIRIEDLPDNWSDFTQLNYTQMIGDIWLSGMSSAVLSVPSAIIPQERNFLINMQHPDFQKIKLLQVEDFDFDPRIKTT